MTNISATHRHTPLLTWIVTTDFVPRTWCCFQRASRKSRGQKWGHMKGVSVYVCVGEREGGGGRLQPLPGCPLSSCVSHHLVSTCHWHTRGYLPTQVAPINGCPTALSVVLRASLGDKKWSGICLSGDTGKEFKEGRKVMQSHAASCCAQIGR